MSLPLSSYPVLCPCIHMYIDENLSPNPNIANYLKIQNSIRSNSNVNFTPLSCTVESIYATMRPTKHWQWRMTNGDVKKKTLPFNFPNPSLLSSYLLIPDLITSSLSLSLSLSLLLLWPSFGLFICLLSICLICFVCYCSICQCSCYRLCWQFIRLQVHWHTSIL